MRRGCTVVLPLHLLPPIVSEYPEIANQLTLRHSYIAQLEAGQQPEVGPLPRREVALLQAEYEEVFLAYPVLLQQLRTAECYLRGLLLHCQAPNSQKRGVSR